ncbi:MAG TPA: DNA gyrase C-terminal beta-propeller domain-containing protein, partial [Saprospiraceae bacterium]|nr:DNA gyrase C-terminal beta-propeller domain-containing protein [Saprospiraceae bacterium]
NEYILFATKKGLVKRTPLEAFSRPRSNGIIAINIRENDELLIAKLTSDKSEVVMANKNGRAIRFDVGDVRSMGRTAAGVRGMSLDDDTDEVIGMVVFEENDDDFHLLVVSEKGMGKRSLKQEYRKTKRGGKGVKTLQISTKTGQLIALKAVRDDFDLMITSLNGIVIRMPVSDMRVMGRATQGVRLINLQKDDEIADVAVVRNEDNADEEE